MNSVSSLEKALQGSHTVFLVTNYYESMRFESEFAQGKNVTDAAKVAGVSHIIFSSLVHVTEATSGRLSHFPYFDSKAKIEKYIRESGMNCTFVMPGYFMSNFREMLRKAEDGTYQLFCPIDGEKAQFPLFDPASDLGLFVKPALKDPAAFNGKQILAAARYYTAEDIVAAFTEVTGKKAVLIQVTPDQYKASLVEAVAQETLENHLLIESPGYYSGKSLDESLKLLDAKPTSWEDYVKSHAAEWA